MLHAGPCLSITAHWKSSYKTRNNPSFPKLHMPIKYRLTHWNSTNSKFPCSWANVRMQGFQLLENAFPTPHHKCLKTWDVSHRCSCWGTAISPLSFTGWFTSSSCHFKGTEVYCYMQLLTPHPSPGARDPTRCYSSIRPLTSSVKHHGWTSRVRKIPKLHGSLGGIVPSPFCVLIY